MGGRCTRRDGARCIAKPLELTANAKGSFNISSLIPGSKLLSCTKVAKTEFMVISSRQKLQSLRDCTMNIRIDSVPIDQSNQSKSLGLINDENLSWKAYIHEISKKVSSSISAGQGICFNAHCN